MKAMVLAAGLGTRMGGLTQDWPKPMLDVQGAPILEHILRNLARHGFKDVVINLHFHPQVIERHFGDGSRLGLRLTWIHEERLLGTAGSVKNAAPFLQGPGPILVHYGDVLTDQDLTAMVDFHERKGSALTLLLHERARSNSIVRLDGDQRILELLERPDEAARAKVASPWVNSGIYLLEPPVLEAIPPGVPCDFPRDIFPGVIASGRAHGFPLTGYRCAIDSPERLEKARAEFPAVAP
jgi:mannose-1-phosphate guanylyltransferase/phosphomannomutase